MTPDPAPVGVAVARRDQLEDVVGQLGEQAGLLDRADRARLLGEEDVGGRVRALLDQGRGEVAGLAEARLDVGVGLGLVGVDRAADRAPRSGPSRA